ncbi:hypothetical protein CIPAW_11G166500 [Carya illinoinensis]|uniref:Uncharacterized protein n=1 Tax=Carya illinoinensis TaxID=32201 RepID=A0A8T1P8G7_CARIL|nr:hypothetical protein CIPAW_11G166500 [Carya illinoinensis]
MVIVMEDLKDWKQEQYQNYMMTISRHINHLKLFLNRQQIDYRQLCMYHCHMVL